MCPPIGLSLMSSTLLAHAAPVQANARLLFFPATHVQMMGMMTRTMMGVRARRHASRAEGVGAEVALRRHPRSPRPGHAGVWCFLMMRMIRRPGPRFQAHHRAVQTCLICC